MGERKRARIAAVCGAGMATCTWIASVLNNKLTERGFDVTVVPMKIIELTPETARDLDLIVCATKLEDRYGCPVIEALSILTGVGIDDVIGQIVAELEK